MRQATTKAETTPGVLSLTPEQERDLEAAYRRDLEQRIAKLERHVNYLMGVTPV